MNGETLLAGIAKKPLANPLLLEGIALIGPYGNLVESVLVVVQGLVEKFRDDVGVRSSASSRHIAHVERASLEEPSNAPISVTELEYP